MHSFYIVPDIKHYTRENVKYERETYSKKGGINKKQPDLGDRNIKFFAKVGAYTK